MAEKAIESHPPAALVGLAAWLVPGAGYWLLGQRVRALTVGITIVALFLFGLLIGGVRSLEVPGYNARGQKIYENARAAASDSDEKPAGTWKLLSHPMDEIRAKPWSIAQVMTGPLDLACSYWSLNVSAAPTGVRSHARVNEIGVLYTAIAGMLNLLTIIDASHRAGQEPTK